MPHIEDYLCDVCSNSILPREPCHIAIEVPRPRAYIGVDGGDIYRKVKYICGMCLTLKRDMPRKPRGLWERIRETLDDMLS